MNRTCASRTTRFLPVFLTTNHWRSEAFFPSDAMSTRYCYLTSCLQDDDLSVSPSPRCLQGVPPHTGIPYILDS